VASHYRVEALGNGLRIKAGRDMERWERLFMVAIAAILAGVASAGIVGG
jgi:hypothetical protein